MRPLTRRETAVVVGGVTLAVLLVLYFLVFLPRLTALTQANRQLRTKIAHFAEVEQTAARLPVAVRQHAEVEAQLRGVERRIPGSLQIPELVAELNSAIQATGVQLVEITFPEVPRAQPGAPAGQVVDLQEVPFSLRVRGTFAQTVAFLGQIEILPRVVTVRILGISEPADRAAAALGRTSLDVSMNMTTFVLR